MDRGTLQDPPSGAFCELEQLINLKLTAGSLDLGQRRRALSMLAGGNKANFRGRGIDFEEVRSYQPGDDIRTIDWRVTARTGSAHTKLFREERERPVMVVCDQRNNMFFGSRSCFKSVLAAHLASVLAWAALARGDRVGGLVFNDHEQQEVRPRRSRRSVLALLHKLQGFGEQLPLETPSAAVDFAAALQDLRRVTKPGSALFLISDFADALDTQALEHLYQLSRHCEVTALHVSDPLEQELPDSGLYAVTNGKQRVNLFTGERRLRQQFSEYYQQQLSTLRAEYGKLGIPLIEASTRQSALVTLQTFYSSRRPR